MSLKKVAASMHVEAKEKGRAFRRLRGGLRLALYYRLKPKDDIVLKLSRHAIKPSDTEVKVCQMYFFGDCETSLHAEKNTVYLFTQMNNFYFN